MSEPDARSTVAVSRFEEIGVGKRPAAKLSDKFHTEDHLVEFLVEGGELSDFEGVGEKSAEAVHRWFKQEHPDKNLERKQNDQAYCTEFTTDHGLAEHQEEDADKPLWAWICPRCSEKNVMHAEPSACSGRPYACIECQWVPLLDPQSMQELIDELEGDDA